MTNKEEKIFEWLITRMGESDQHWTNFWDQECQERMREVFTEDQTLVLGKMFEAAFNLGKEMAIFDVMTATSKVIQSQTTESP
jgi:hypothetical protein